MAETIKPALPRETRVQLRALDAPPDVVLTPRVQRMRNLVGRYRPFALVVLLPTIFAALYLGLIAADRYEVEARFVVRAPAAGGSGQLASIVQGSSIIRSTDDAHAVHAYMRSRDAIADLVKSVDLHAKLSRREIDPLWRYPLLPFASTSREGFWKHAQQLIDVDYDTSTGISRLRVSAFTPDDARSIAVALLDHSEKLINRLSERAQGDAVKSADQEVARARKIAADAQEQVTAFRTRESIVDPAKSMQGSMETIARLALEVAQTNANLAEVQKASPQSTQIVGFKTRIVALEEQINKERRLLAGGDTSLAPIIAEYERLTLQREFAERTFTSALSSLEVARQDAQRQRLFLERISSPVLPDEAKYPRRLLAIFGVFAMFWMAYRIMRRLIGDALTHAEV